MKKVYTIDNPSPSDFLIGRIQSNELLNQLKNDKNNESIESLRRYICQIENKINRIHSITRELEKQDPIFFGLWDLFFDENKDK